MSNTYGYNPPGTIKNFKCLREVTCWAGALGVIQSLIWMGLTLIGILSYNCIISIESKLSFGSLMQTVFFDLYFKGNCNPDGYQDYNNTMLHSVDTVLDPKQILIWNSVYLAVAFCWFLASMLALTQIKKDNVNGTLVVLYTWIFLTLGISLMDFALGVIFGIDYTNFNDAAYGFNLNSANAGEIDPNASQLVAAMVASISLMIISFKGFVLWLINVGLMVYLLAQAMRIAGDTDGNDTLFMPRKESDDILTTRAPINAYDDPKPSPMAFTNEAYGAEDDSVAATIELNQDSIARAARMSTDASLQDRRFRNLDAFQQYPPPRYNNRPDSKPEAAAAESAIAVAAFPAPDYSPPMSRANQGGQSHNGPMRNQRF